MTGSRAWIPGDEGQGRNPDLLLALLIALITIFQFVTIRAGHAWGDDHALYIMHARALLEGRAYGDTGFIYNTATPWYSPRVYPPGLPLLLVPLYAIAGLNLTAMKCLVTAFFIGSVILTAVLFRPQLSRVLLLALVALIGFQPYFTEFKNNVLPDLPYMFFACLALILMRRMERPGMRGRDAVFWGLLAGVSAYYAMALRTVGIALFAGLAFAVVVRLRLPGRAVLACFAAGLVLWAIQHALLVPPDSGYVNQLADSSARTGPADLLPKLGKAKALLTETFLLWQGPPRSLRNLLGLTVLLVGTTGFVLRLRRPSPVEGYVLAYAGAIYVYPGFDFRYIAPLAPFILYYAAVAVDAGAKRFGRRGLVPAAALGVTLAGSYGAGYAQASFGPMREGANTPTAVAMYRFIDTCTRPDERVMFEFARVLTLYTRRPGLKTPDLDKVNMPRFVAEQRIGWAVALRGDRLEAWVNRTPAMGLEPAYANRDLIVYRTPLAQGSLQAKENPICSRPDAVAARRVSAGGSR